MSIASVIKYEGGNDTFIWKHPVEDFNIGSQLIVHESQEAVFFMNGQALDLFGPGRHTLETQNLPFVGKFFNRSMGGQSPFHCEVYFINKTEQLAVKWGTDSKLEYVEPSYGFPIQIGASGEMSLRVEDSRKLLVKVVGTELGIIQSYQGTPLNNVRGLTHQSFVQRMRAFLLTRIKNHLASFIKTERISIFEIDEHLLRISEELHKAFRPDFLDYGVSLERFFVTAVVKPEEDANYRRFKELHFRQYADIAEARLRQQTGVIEQETQAKRMVIEAEGLARKRALEGYSYQDERGFDVAERVAANEAVGQMTNMGVGLGMMAGVGGTVGAAVGGMMRNTMGDVLEARPAPAGTPCPDCGAMLPKGARFCPECGRKTGAAGEIRCPQCGSETSGGKFCPECGASLIRKCPECGAEVPPNGKFCLSCGHKLQQEEA